MGVLIAEKVRHRRYEPARGPEGARVGVARRMWLLAGTTMVIAGGERPSDARRHRWSASFQRQGSQHIALQERLERPAGHRLECLAEEHICEVRVAEGRRRLGERELPP